MKEIQKYIPLDKSWIIRMGLLDVTHKYDDIIPFLEKQEDLGEDLKSLYKACVDWKKGAKQIYVGESGTVYRFFRFASWCMGLDKEFIVTKTLKERVKKMCNNPDIINWSIDKLRTLGGGTPKKPGAPVKGTTQWASASILMGRNILLEGEIESLPPKIQLSYNGRKHWNIRRFNNHCWIEEYDETIEKQAVAFVNYLKTGKLDFVTDDNAENYCFMRMLGLMTKEKGEKKWPQLRKHETDRIAEMERIIELANKGAVIDTPDHRGLQAHVMKQLWENKEIKVKDKDVVNKSWPKFWEFMKYCEGIKRVA